MVDLLECLRLPTGNFCLNIEYLVPCSFEGLDSLGLLDLEGC